MEFANLSLKDHYEHTLAQIGNDDPYVSPSSLGIFEVVRAHYLIADLFLTEQRELGGVGLHSVESLHSALHRPFVEFGGVVKWQDFFDKVATTLFGLIKDHPFYDANKRTALLSVLYLLSKQGRTTTCTKDEIEDLTVEIANMGVVKRARYKALSAREEDPEVKYISRWLRKNTRTIDTREYTITYRELRKILSKYGITMENPRNNMIDIIKMRKRTGLSALLMGSETFQRIGRIGYPSDTRQVSKGDLRKIRKMCGLTQLEGVDSQSFYYGVDDMTSLLAEYQDNIRRLANR